MPQVKHYGIFRFKRGTDDTQIQTCFTKMIHEQVKELVTPCLGRVIVFDFDVN